jgi:hypothetical protein
VSRLLAGAVLATLALVARVGAQDAGPGPARRDEAFRLVDAYVVSNLQESLSLSDEQFVKVLPLVKRLQGERRDYLLSRARLLREMRRLMRTGATTEARLVERLEELKALEADGPARVRRSGDALDAALTPVQQAKFRLFEFEVEQRMRALMNRARAGGRRPQPE